MTNKSKLVNCRIISSSLELWSDHESIIFCAISALVKYLTERKLLCNIFWIIEALRCVLPVPEEPNKARLQDSPEMSFWAKHWQRFTASSWATFVMLKFLKPQWMYRFFNPEFKSLCCKRCFSISAECCSCAWIPEHKSHVVVDWHSPNVNHLFHSYAYPWKNE